MKVLVIHNFYQSASPSGEDVVFKNEVELLQKNGVDVVTYTRHNDEIMDYGIWGKFILPFRNIWSKRTYKELKELIRKEKPDIAHFHNIWYLLSPSAYYVCKDSGVPVVQTLHNFRIFCANGLLMRNGKVCEECIPEKIDDRPWIMGDRFKIIKNAFMYGCYRNSRFYSLPIAFIQWFHWVKRTWIDTVDIYVALTEFGKKKFIEACLPSDKIFVKPNFLANPPEPNYTHQNYAVFIGRLSIEKGVNILIDSLKYLQLTTSNHFRLKIIGDGPLRGELEDKVSNDGIKNIEFTGRKDFNSTMEVLQYSKFMILPAIWYEGFPMVIREAFACGKPVIASNLGAMAELVEEGKTGLLFESGNYPELAQKIKWMIENEDACIQMSKNARKVFEEKYTAECNYEILMDIYHKAIQKYKAHH